VSVEPPWRSPENVRSAAEAVRASRAVVLVEAVVLGGDQRVDHIGRDLGQLDPVAVGPAVDRELLAVGRQHLRGLFGLGLADVADARRERDQQQDIEQHQRRDGGHRQHDLAPRGTAQMLTDQRQA
jgi:hypothetical protein